MSPTADQSGKSDSFFAAESRKASHLAHGDTLTCNPSCCPSNIVWNHLKMFIWRAHHLQGNDNLVIICRGTKF